MNKRTLSERDICTKFITPALEKAGYASRKTFASKEINVVGLLFPVGLILGQSFYPGSFLTFLYTDDKVFVSFMERISQAKDVMEEGSSIVVRFRFKVPETPFPVFADQFPDDKFKLLSHVLFFLANTAVGYKA